MRRREGYYFPCTICPYQKVKLGRMSVKTMPHTIGVWMPVKIQFFFVKQIYKLSIFWCIWKFKSLTYSNCVPSGFPGLLQTSGTSEPNCLAWPTAGKGLPCSRPGQGATVRPPSPGCPQWPKEPQWGREETVLLSSRFSFPHPSLTLWFFISERTTVALSSPCQGLHGRKVRVCHIEHRIPRVRNM